MTLWLPRHSLVEPAPAATDPVFDLSVAEYQSVRAESLQSFVSTQSIIQWFLAIYGVLFVAGLVSLTTDTPDDNVGVVRTLTYLLFGLIVPGITAAATWHWLGEITRMERTGAYLRGYEIHVNGTDVVRPKSSPRPNWETFLRAAPFKARAPKRQRNNKRTMTYVATAGMFLGCFLAAIASSVFLEFQWRGLLLNWDGVLAYVDVSTWHLARWGFVALRVILVAGYVTVCLVLGRSVKRLGRLSFDFASQKLVTTESLTASK